MCFIFVHRKPVLLQRGSAKFGVLWWVQQPRKHGRLQWLQWVSSLFLVLILTLKHFKGDVIMLKPWSIYFVFKPMVYSQKEVSKITIQANLHLICDFKHYICWTRWLYNRTGLGDGDVTCKKWPTPGSNQMTSIQMSYFSRYGHCHILRHQEAMIGVKSVQRWGQ